MAWGADKPFLTTLAISRWKSRYRHWPPKGSSPVTPIEPWGKQFFVYNAPRRALLHGDPRAPPLDDIRPAWVRDENMVSMMRGQGTHLRGVGAPTDHKTLVETRRAGQALNRKAGESTLLCCTDYRQRPLLFMKPEEWSAFLLHLPALKQQLRACQVEQC